jgi:hypothetical protein
MIQLDFISVVVGYIIGVILCYQTMHLLYADAQETGPTISQKYVPNKLADVNTWEIYKYHNKWDKNDKE